MGALSKQEAAKKGPKKASLHTEPIHELPKAVDWDEQERIKQSLKGKFMPQFRKDGKVTKTSYDPARGAELCIMRRGGLNMKQISVQAKIAIPTIKKWKSDYPEFAQEWNDGYTDYITDLAEELPVIAEKLIEGLRRNGKKLSDKQHGRYMRSLDFFAQQVQFAAKHRDRALYGDSEGGMELVLVQPTNLPTRTVTQDVPRAEAWKEEMKEAEDATFSVQDPSGSDGSGGSDDRLPDSEGSGGEDLPDVDESLDSLRRDKGRSSPVRERGERIEDEGEGTTSD